VKHSVSNGKRHVSNVNKRAKMFAVCAWTQIAVLLLCYNTQGGTGGVSFANKNVSGLQKCFKISK
jgi:hypothetical protein